MNLDLELVARARAILGTEQATETVHAALDDVVARDRRRRLAERDFADLTPESLEELRKPSDLPATEALPERGPR